MWEKQTDEETWIAAKITRYERDLKNVYWFFLVGFGAILLGLFFIWLVVSRVTLFRIGLTRVIADPITFGIGSIFSIFLGFSLLVVSIYVRIRYPYKLKELRDILNISKANEELDQHKA